MQQRQQNDNLNFTRTNEKLMKALVEEFQASSKEQPIGFQEFLQNIMDEYDNQQANDMQQYDPKNYFKDSYKHMMNLVQPFNDLEQGQIIYNKPQKQQEIQYQSKINQLKIKSKRDQNQKQLQSIGFQDEEDFQRINEEQQDQSYLSIEDNRPIQRLTNQEFYQIRDEESLEKKQKMHAEYLKKKSNFLLACQRENYKQTGQRVPLVQLNINQQVKQLKKFVDTNLYHKQIETLEQIEEPQEEEYENAKKYFKEQIEQLQNSIEYYQNENERLRKEKLDINHQFQVLKYEKDMFEYNKFNQIQEFEELKKKEYEKIKKKQAVLDMIQKTHSNEPNQILIQEIDNLKKQIEDLKIESDKKQQKLKEKKQKYQKYYKDKIEQTTFLEEQITSYQQKIAQLTQIINEYESNTEVQELIENQKKQKLKLQQQEIEKKANEQKIQQEQIQEIVKPVPLFELIQHKDYWQFVF